MATETKLAYVVGLAFIVCFAVILTRRGQQPHVEESLLDRVSVDLGTVSGGPVTDAVSRPTAPVKHAAQPPRSVSPEVSAASDDVVAGPSPAAAHAPGNGSPGGDSTPGGLISKEAADKIDALINGVTGHKTHSAESAVDESTSSGPALANRPAGGSGPASAGADHSSVKLTSYTVAKGETLHQIARRLYGAKWKQGLDSLLAANRTALPDPNQVRAGVELHIPSLSDAGAPSSDDAAGRSSDAPGGRPGAPSRDAIAAAPGPSAKSVTGSASDGKTIEYEVKKGDTYYSIARQLLGNQGRWKEIQELNKDRVSDPSTMREGAKIRVPASATSARN